MRGVTVRIERVNKKVPLPRYMTGDASGMDLCAAIQKKMDLKPFERMLIPTGIKVEIPRGYELQVRPRSGLAWKHGVGILNSPGTIDSDYRGEIKVILVNLSGDSFVIKPGERIAQMVLSKVERAQFKVVRRVKSTRRGSGGFGHTGTGTKKYKKPLRSLKILKTYF